MTKQQDERANLRLMPCPFCGENSDLHVYEHYDDDAYVQCRECTTCGPDGGDFAGAVIKWNTRAALLQADAVVFGEAIGFMHAGHVHELQQKRISYGCVYMEKQTGASVPLYTHPQQAAQVAQPLTPDQLADRCESWLHSAIPITNVVDAFESGFRDAEAAHGIGKDHG